MSRISNRNRRARITRPAKRNRPRTQVRRLFRESGLTQAQVVRIFAAMTARDNPEVLDQIADFLAREAIADDFEPNLAYLCREILIQLGEHNDAANLGPDTPAPGQ